jgi:hypothetical protein
MLINGSGCTGVSGRPKLSPSAGRPPAALADRLRPTLAAKVSSAPRSLQTAFHHLPSNIDKCTFLTIWCIILQHQLVSVGNILMYSNVFSLRICRDSGFMVSAFSAATNNRENPWYNGHHLWEPMEKVRSRPLWQLNSLLFCLTASI